MIITITIIFFIILDRFFKFLTVNHYFDAGVNILGDILRFNFASNYNIAFSLPLNSLFLNIIVVLIILGLVYYLLYLTSRGKFLNAVFLLSVILGASSNLLDRLKFGYVIDYLDLKYFTVFNLADVMIVLGVVGLVWLMVEVDKR
jgi:signal peptidase II